MPDPTLSAFGPPEAESLAGSRRAKVRSRLRFGLIARVLLFVVLGVALFAVLLKLAGFHPLSSDGANNALQGWDMLHGNVLLSGWIIGDATYYTLELPLLAVVEGVTGLSPHVVEVEVSLTFLLVLGLGMAVARGRSTGMLALLRCLAVLAALTAPLASPPGELIMLSVPIHFGTAAFMLLSFLIYDRAPGPVAWRYAAPVVMFAVLVLGQLGDATVLYCGVLPVIIVGCYRLLFGKRMWSRDPVFVVAAALSVPAEHALRSMILRHGGYTMILPKTAIVPARQWLTNARITAIDVAQLFGWTGPGRNPGFLWFLHVSTGMIALAAAVLGALTVLVRWRRSDPCEQLVLLGVGLNLVGFVVTPNADLGSAYDLCFALSGGAVLAARLVTPRLAERLTAPGTGIARARWAIPLVAMTICSLILGLTLQPQPTVVPQLASFLQDHDLTYGLAAYDDASSVTLQSEDAVQVRAVVPTPSAFDAYQWETKVSWFDKNRHTATFFIANQTPGAALGITVDTVEARYGQPERLYAVDDREILVYRGNLLDKVAPPGPGGG